MNNLLLIAIFISIFIFSLDAEAQDASAQIELRGTVPSYCEKDKCNDPNIIIYYDEKGKKNYEMR